MIEVDVCVSFQLDKVTGNIDNIDSFASGLHVSKVFLGTQLQLRKRIALRLEGDALVFIYSVGNRAPSGLRMFDGTAATKSTKIHLRPIHHFYSHFSLQLSTCPANHRHCWWDPKPIFSSFRLGSGRPSDSFQRLPIESDHD